MDDDIAVHADGCIYQPARRTWDIGDIAVETAYDDLEVMEYTGLLDKNGKEIYEGDIVKHNGTVKIQTLIIAFHDGAFCIGKDGIRDTAFKSWVTLRDAMGQASRMKTKLYLEVIGNIYENPELLSHA